MLQLMNEKPLVLEIDCRKVCGIYCPSLGDIDCRRLYWYEPNMNESREWDVYTAKVRPILAIASSTQISPSEFCCWINAMSFEIEIKFSLVSGVFRHWRSVIIPSFQTFHHSSDSTSPHYDLLHYCFYCFNLYLSFVLITKPILPFTG